jgi:hypothetical protein
LDDDREVPNTGNGTTYPLADLGAIRAIRVTITGQTASAKTLHGADEKTRVMTSLVRLQNRLVQYRVHEAHILNICYRRQCMDHQSEKKRNSLHKIERAVPALKRQRGIALIMVLVMLTLLGMLGVYALGTSNTELHIAGNYRNEQIAFSNCNDIEAFGPNNQTVLNTIVPYILNSYPNGTGFQRIYPDVYPAPAGFQGQTLVRVEFVCASQPIIANVQDQETFLDYHFLVTIVGKGSNNSECVVESEFVQTRPRPIGSDPDC